MVLIFYGTPLVLHPKDLRSLYGLIGPEVCDFYVQM